MCEALHHRGPDDQGLYVEGGVGLGVRRLSIIDLAGGRQPIFNEDRSKVIVFNGEIYNYRDLRPQLVDRGHSLQSSSDTETILHLYEDHGPACVDRLRGMFAFAIGAGGSCSRATGLASSRCTSRPAPGVSPSPPNSRRSSRWDCRQDSWTGKPSTRTCNWGTSRLRRRPFGMFASLSRGTYCCGDAAASSRSGGTGTSPRPAVPSRSPSSGNSLSGSTSRLRRTL